MMAESDSNSIPPNQESIDGITPQAKADQKSGQPQVESPLGSDIKPSPDHKGNTEHCRPDQTPTGKHILEVLAAGILACYTFAAFQQLGVMSDQLGQMQASGKQTDRLLCLYQQQLTELQKQSTETHNLAVAADTQAKAAKVQSDNTVKLANAASNQVAKLQAGVDQTSRLAVAAEGANTSAARALEAQLRPWLGIVGEPEDAKEGDFLKGVDPPTHEITFNLRFKNYGQSPAMRVTVNSMATFKSTVDVDKAVCDGANKQALAEPHFLAFNTIFPSSEKPIPVSGITPMYRIVVVCTAYRGSDAALPPYNTWIAYEYLRHPNPEGKTIYDFKVLDYEAK